MAKAKLKTRATAKKKKAAPPREPSTRAREPSIKLLESKLGRLDRDLLKRLNDRATLVQKIGKYRQAEGQSASVPGHDDETLARLAGLGKGPLPERCIRAVFRELLSGSRALLHETRVAMLGPMYSYSHLAAIHRFGQSVEFVPVGSIAAVFEEVNRRQADFGLVPIENSTDGRIADTLDMFTRLPVRVCGEVELAIHHTLLAKCPRTEIKEVYSRPQALSQCRNWLAKHLPSARTIEVTSTTTAAQLAKEKPGAAAVASLQAGVHYGLDILAEQIEDNPSNTTRFAIIGDHSAERTGNDKTALMFQTEHKPGALADTMAIFKRNRLNMTWIESFPVPGPKRAYLFFVELEGHETDARVRRATAALERKALRLEILGSFAATPPVE